MKYIVAALPIQDDDMSNEMYARLDNKIDEQEKII